MSRRKHHLRVGAGARHALAEQVHVEQLGEHETEGGFVVAGTVAVVLRRCVPAVAVAGPERRGIEDGAESRVEGLGGGGRRAVGSRPISGDVGLGYWPLVVGMICCRGGGRVEDHYQGRSVGGRAGQEAEVRGKELDGGVCCRFLAAREEGG